MSKPTCLNLRSRTPLNDDPDEQGRIRTGRVDQNDHPAPRIDSGAPQHGVEPHVETSDANVVPEHREGGGA
jgi:hypothetical protein